MIDLAAEQALGAIFLPAIQPMYGDFPYRDGKVRALPDRVELRDLDFLNQGSKLFRLKYALCSAGTHAQSARPNMVTERDRSNTIIVGDSGGYQVIGGKLAWKGNTTRQLLLNWLEEHCDWAMTLDAPTAAIASRNGRYLKYEHCLHDTLESLDYFSRHREGRVKFLNVLQGRDEQEADHWYEAVKHHDFEGWAFAGDTKLDLYLLIRRLLTMHNDGRLERTQWIHVLGVGNLNFAAALTFVQAGLERMLGRRIPVSFDASSPFLMAKSRTVYRQARFDRARLTISSTDLPPKRSPEAMEVGFPFSSPIGDRLKWRDLWTPKGSRTLYDSLSHVLCQNHNVYIHCRAIADLNRALLLPDEASEAWLPKHLLQIRQTVYGIFGAKDRMARLKSRRSDLKPVVQGTSERDRWEAPEKP